MFTGTMCLVFVWCSLTCHPCILHLTPPLPTPSQLPACKHSSRTTPPTAVNTTAVLAAPLLSYHYVPKYKNVLYFDIQYKWGLYFWTKWYLPFPLPLCVCTRTKLNSLLIIPLLLLPLLLLLLLFCTFALLGHLSHTRVPPMQQGVPPRGRYARRHQPRRHPEEHPPRLLRLGRPPVALQGREPAEGRGPDADLGKVRGRAGGEGRRERGEFCRCGSRFGARDHGREGRCA